MREFTAVHTVCAHCGDDCEEVILYRDKTFCCRGCRTVYELLTENGLDSYYRLNTTPGTAPATHGERFAYLDNAALQERHFDQ